MTTLELANGDRVRVYGEGEQAVRRFTELHQDVQVIDWHHTDD